MRARRALAWAAAAVGLTLVLALAALVATAWWSVRITRRAQVLNERLTGEQAHLNAGVQRLRMSLAETALLWQPYRRLLRWLSHPLAIAALQSYARRRATR